MLVDRSLDLLSHRRHRIEKGVCVRAQMMFLTEINSSRNDVYGKTFVYFLRKSFGI